MTHAECIGGPLDGKHSPVADGAVEMRVLMRWEPRDPPAPTMPVRTGHYILMEPDDAAPYWEWNGEL